MVTTAVRSPTSAAPSPQVPSSRPEVSPRPPLQGLCFILVFSSLRIYHPRPPWADQPYPRGLEKREKLPSTLPELLSHPWAREARPGGAPFVACPLHVCGPPACGPTLLLGLVSEIHHPSPETKPRPHQGSEGSPARHPTVPGMTLPHTDPRPPDYFPVWAVSGERTARSAPSHPGVPTQYSFPPTSF